MALDSGLRYHKVKWSKVTGVTLATFFVVLFNTLTLMELEIVFLNIYHEVGFISEEKFVA